MATISPRFPSPPSPSSIDPKFLSKPPKFLFTPLHNPPFSLPRCRSSKSDSPNQPNQIKWTIQDVVTTAKKKLDDYLNSFQTINNQTTKRREEEEEDDVAIKNKEAEHMEWTWERWQRHFDEMDDQAEILSDLKMQFRDAVAREDFEDAGNLKLAISAAARTDTVGMSVSDLNKAIKEECYKDAAFLRDHAGVGLVGWWAGISEDSADPYGRIIQISAEHGRYVARSYNSRQLATARPGFPLFEVFFTLRDGKYKQQAVYLKQKRKPSRSIPKKSVKKSDVNSLNKSDSSTEGQNDIYSEDINTIEEEGDDESDVADEMTGIQSVLRDMIPGVNAKVLKVVSPGKVDIDLISKVTKQMITIISEQIIEGEDEFSDEESEGFDIGDVRPESDIEEVIKDAGDSVKDAGDAFKDATEEQNEPSVKFVFSTLIRKMSPKDLVRVPAKLEKKDHLSFLFSIEQDDKKHEIDGTTVTLQRRPLAVSRSADLVMSDLAKVVLSKEKIPMKALVEELLDLTMNQTQNHQPLTGATLFNRIEIPNTSDPLSGLYVGAHGMYTSDILHLKRKYGQWQEDNVTKKNKNLEFYEYVEAYKLTGGTSVPAGQVAFRAKVGKQNQLPHKGIIPEEFGMVARYKGQGRFADPGFKNPRWVDGELVILDGKLLRDGPVIGFVYWAPGQSLVFFNRLTLPD